MRLVALFLVLAVLGGCGGDDDDSAADGRTGVVAAFYPLAWVAEEIGGDAVDVANLTPVGTEPHDLELTPDRIEQIDTAGVVFVLGGDFQPALEEAAAGNDGTVEVFDAVGADGDDPHVWLDPGLMVAVVSVVEAALAAADPAHADDFRARADQLRADVEALDEEFATGLAECERTTIVTAHDAFGRLADRYGLTQEPIAGISPEQEPPADRLAELADLAENEGVTTIFTEELVPPEIAETVAREAGGLRTEVLNPLEGLTDDDIEAGADYLSVMRDNLAKLREALDCA